MDIELLKDESPSFFRWWKSNVEPFKWYSCNECKRHYKSEEDFKKHQWEIHNIGIGEIFKCDLCNKDFRKKDLFNKHKLKYHYNLFINNTI